jgi:uncharacterized protein
MPAVDVHQSAAFYEQVFGWNIRGRDTDRPSFDDGTGDVSGAWVTDQAISREPGLLPYISVDRIDDTLEQVEAQGEEVVKAPYPEGNMWVATFRDPCIGYVARPFVKMRSEQRFSIVLFYNFLKVYGSNFDFLQ